MKNHIEIIDENDEDFDSKFAMLMNTQGSTSDYSNERNREYNGQPWTNEGERGKQEIKNITMRDLKDCLIQAFLKAAGDEKLSKKVFEISDDPDIGKGTKYSADGTWRAQDVYKIKNDFDPIAVCQAFTCFVEHYMNLYPNTKNYTKEILSEIR